MLALGCNPAAVMVGQSCGRTEGRARAREALRLRQEGLTYRQIGKEIGRTQERARQLVAKAERIIAFAKHHGREVEW